MLNNTLVILCLIAVDTFLSMSEIPPIASRKIKPKLLADEGNIDAQHVLSMQEDPGTFFTMAQIGLNAVAILGDIVGDVALSPAFHSLFSRYMSAGLSEQLSFTLSFSLATGMFILFVDLAPKHIGMTAPEAVVLRIVNPACLCLYACIPLMWFFNGLVNIIFCIFKLPMVRRSDITSDDIYAVMEAGVLTDVLRKQEYELTENVFKLESRTVPFSMIPRENVTWFDLHEDRQSLKNKAVGHPYSKFPVYNEDINHIIGHVDSKNLLNHVSTNRSLALNSSVQIHNTLIMSDTLALSEVLESFKTAGGNPAVIVNGYALIVGIITPNDVMTTLMDDLVDQGLEKRTVARDENSQLIDGGTPIDDVIRVLDIDEFPQSGNYETIGGLMMFVLCKIPKRIDSVKFVGYKFETVDTDNYRTNQPLVTRINSKATVLSPKLPDAKGEGESVT